MLSLLGLYHAFAEGEPAAHVVSMATDFKQAMLTQEWAKEAIKQDSKLERLADITQYEIRNAKKEPTYLLADVEVIAEYKLANINCKSLEALLHKLFAPARLDMELKDRFGSHVEPREWFLVPLSAVDQAICRIKDGSIRGYKYDPSSATLVSH